MTDDRSPLDPEDDRELLGAFRAVRDTYDGANEEADLTLQRALFRTRAVERKRRLSRWVLLPAAAALVASSAWAGVTGRLSPAVQSLLEVVHVATPHDVRDVPVAMSPAPPAPVTPPSTNDSAPEPPVAAQPAPVAMPSAPAAVPVAPATPVVPASRPATPVAPPEAPPPSPAEFATLASKVGPTGQGSGKPEAPLAPAASAASVAPTVSAPDPLASLFAEAHRVHFGDRDAARALVLWDRYLVAAPQGRFAPEARYNRALTLIRLGRRIEAQQELAAFATGMYGDYRREEAKALLDALGRDAAAP